MHLTVEQMKRWVRDQGPGEYIAQLREGDSLPVTELSDRVIEGPVIASVTVYRDGGWRVVARPSWTTEDIGR